MFKNDKLKTSPYKGVRDFYPPDMFVQNYIFGIMRKTAESFGYLEYGASILEPAELYRGKTSEEIVSEQTYTFTDRGKREVTLRPEMTPTIARMIAAKRRELAFPLRWYSIPNIFRYERPQRGRLREHWQLNCDIFGLPAAPVCVQRTGRPARAEHAGGQGTAQAGIAGIEAEAEIISLAYRLMKNFGAKDADFEIRVNSRKIINAVLAQKNFSTEQIREFTRKLDRGEPVSADFNFAPDEEIKALLAALKENGISNVRFEPTLARGFDYYTGIVFEVFDTAPQNNRALFGGGRYDNLMAIFGEKDIPAVGFGMGDVTARDFLETRNLLPSYRPAVDLVICAVDDRNLKEINETASRLREKGINLALDFTDRKIGDKIKSADKQAVPFIVCVGEEEIKTGKFKLKNLKTGEETTLSENEILKFIRTSSLTARNEQSDC